MVHTCKLFQREPDKVLLLQYLLWCLTTQSFPICLLCLLSCWPSTGTQSECLQVSESVRRLLHLTWKVRILTDFYSQTLWELLFSVPKPSAREPLCGAGDHCSFKRASAAELSLPMLSHHAQLWDQPTLFLHPFYWSRCGSLFISLDMCYDQLYFRWFPTLIVVCFGCNFNALLERGETCFI